MDHELRELYQEVILDHARSPRNHGEPEGANRHAEGVNPLCGDHVKVHIKVEDDVIQNIGFEGGGCAISTASVSMLTECLRGRTVAEVQVLFEAFQSMVRGGDDPHAELGKLQVLRGVSGFPVRVKCATLCWHTARAALEQRTDTVSTEDESGIPDVRAERP